MRCCQTLRERLTAHDGESNNPMSVVEFDGHHLQRGVHLSSVHVGLLYQTAALTRRDVIERCWPSF